MDSNINKTRLECPTGEISAYIDGELSSHEEMTLEMHFAECPLCINDLNAQKQFLRALDLSLEDTGEFALPENFTKTVVTAAETRVSGLRRSGEKRNALFICSGLLLIALFSVGNDLPLLMSALGVATDKFAAVAVFTANFVFDIALGIAVVLRSLASQFVFGSTAGMLSFAAIFGFSIIVFSRLLNRERKA